MNAEISKGSASYMKTTKTSNKQGMMLVISSIVIAAIYQFLPAIFKGLGITSGLQFVGAIFNAVLMGGSAYLILKDEFLEWFKHFSFKWLLIGIPLLLVVGIGAGSLWGMISNVRAENTVNSILSWSYVITHVPFMILGEELLCISILYAIWKKMGWDFWQATLICSVLFAVWHLPSYDYNLLQCLVTIIPSRLVLNYLFKKSDSIWVTFIVHLAFDIFSFLPILLAL